MEVEHKAGPLLGICSPLYDVGHCERPLQVRRDARSKKSAAGFRRNEAG